jgi:hypothetical protein
MIKIPANIPVRMRLPLTAWVLLALVTLFSIGSRLENHVAPLSGYAGLTAQRPTTPEKTGGS